MTKDEYESLLDKSSDILSKSNISEERLKILKYLTCVYLL